MIRCLTAILLLGITSGVIAGEFSSRFSLVLIDDKTEQHLGNFPYDRSVYAQAINACAHYEVKAVILKFFLDLPKSKTGDSELTEAMRKIPVILQARLNTPDGTMREIPKKFALQQPEVAAGYHGKNGWIPLAEFMQTAQGIGFVDFSSVEKIPLTEEYNSIIYPSLIVYCLELATGKKAVFSSQNTVKFGNHTLTVNESNIYSGTINHWQTIPHLSLVDLMEHKTPQEDLKGKIVILGWDTSKTPTIETKHGPRRVHRLFAQCLAVAYNDLIAD